MTDEEFETELQSFLEKFEDKVPNPEQEPMQFAYFVRLYKYYKEKSGPEA